MRKKSKTALVRLLTVQFLLFPILWMWRTARPYAETWTDLCRLAHSGVFWKASLKSRNSANSLGKCRGGSGCGCQSTGEMLSLDDRSLWRYRINMLGLSTQVTAVWSYISDGPYKNYGWDKTKIEFKHRINKEVTSLLQKELKQRIGLTLKPQKNIIFLTLDFGMQELTFVSLNRPTPWKMWSTMNCVCVVTA